MWTAVQGLTRRAYIRASRLLRRQSGAVSGALVYTPKFSTSTTASTTSGHDAATSVITPAARAPYSDVRVKHVPHEPSDQEQPAQGSTHTSQRVPTQRERSLPAQPLRNTDDCVSVEGVVIPATRSRVSNGQHAHQGLWNRCCSRAAATLANDRTATLQQRDRKGHGQGSLHTVDKRGKGA